jgi:hypothetical protein
VKIEIQIINLFNEYEKLATIYNDNDIEEKSLITTGGAANNYNDKKLKLIIKKYKENEIIIDDNTDDLSSINKLLLLLDIFQNSTYSEINIDDIIANINKNGPVVIIIEKIALNVD